MNVRPFQGSQKDMRCLINRLGRLRRQVWCSEPHAIYRAYGDAELWLDDLDFSLQAFHWAVFHQDKLVAAARLSFHSNWDDVPYSLVYKRFKIKPISPFASLNHLVVAQEYRRQGIAQTLDRLRLNLASHLGASAVLALPVDGRWAALHKLGYESITRPLNPQPLGIPLYNAKISVMAAPLSMAASETLPGYSQDQYAMGMKVASAAI